MSDAGHGWSTVMMAKAFPNSHFVGYDFHPGSIEAARAHANSHGVLRMCASKSARRRIIRPPVWTW